LIAILGDKEQTGREYPCFDVLDRASIRQRG